MAYATVAELAAALRIAATAGNTATLQQCLDAAAVEIDAYCDRDEADPIPPDDPLAGRVNIARAAEWWKACDVLFGVLGFDQTGTLTAPRDAFARHAAALTPLKQNWAVA